MTARWRRRYHHWSRPVSEGLILITMWSYVVLVGMSPSVVRAAIMMTVYSLLSLQNRNRSSLNALAFTAIIMLVADPMILFNISFQLSFVAVAFILLYQGRIYSLIPSSSHPIIKWCWSFLSVSLAAQLGVAPLTAYYFHQVPSYFLLSSLVVMVFTPLIIYLSLLFFLLMWLSILLSLKVDKTLSRVGDNKTAIDELRINHAQKEAQLVKLHSASAAEKRLRELGSPVTMPQEPATIVKRK